MIHYRKMTFPAKQPRDPFGFSFGKHISEKKWQELIRFGPISCPDQNQVQEKSSFICRCRETNLKNEGNQQQGSQGKGNHGYCYDSGSMQARLVYEFMEIFFCGALLSLLAALLNSSGKQVFLCRYSHYGPCPSAVTGHPAVRARTSQYTACIMW